MIIPLVAIALALSVPLTGGRVERLLALRLVGTWMVALALVVQVLITTIYVDDLSEQVGAVLHVATYLLAFAFFWRNRAVPGLWVIGLGGAMNFAAITANGGTMPARPVAIELAGLSPHAEFTNSGVVEDAALWFLGDVFALPAGVPFANVFSLGDLVLLLGLGLLLHRTCRDADLDARLAELEVGVEETGVVGNVP